MLKGNTMKDQLDNFSRVINSTEGLSKKGKQPRTTAKLKNVVTKLRGHEFNTAKETTYKLGERDRTNTEMRGKSKYHGKWMGEGKIQKGKKDKNKVDIKALSIMLSTKPDDLPSFTIVL